MPNNLLSYGDTGLPVKVSEPLIVGLAGWADFKFLFAGRNLLGQDGIYAVDQQGRLWSYTDNGNPGNVSGPVEVGYGGWADFKFLFAGRNLLGQDGIYAVDQQGRLWSYTDNGNPGNVSGPVEVGYVGWADFQFLFAGRNLLGQDGIYAVDQQGRLWSYTDNGNPGNVSGPVEVGYGGWADFQTVFGGSNAIGEGRIYALEQQTDRQIGQLWSYGDNGIPGNVSAGDNVGLGSWSDFAFIFSGRNLAGENRIYAVERNGRLWSYGDTTNLARVAEPAVVGLAGWEQFPFKFTGRNLAGEDRIYVVDQAGRLLSYNDNTNFGNVSDPVVVGFGGWLQYASLFCGRDLKGQDRIYAYDPAGERLLSYGDAGTPGNVSAPVEVAVRFVPNWAASQEWGFLFAGKNLRGEDFIYGVASGDSRLMAFQDDGSAGNIAFFNFVGHGWGDFNLLIAGPNLAGENRIYARRADGKVWSYGDDGNYNGQGNVLGAFGRDVGLDLAGGRWIFAVGRNLAGENRLYGSENLGEPNIPWFNFANTQCFAPFPNAQPLTAFPKTQAPTPYSLAMPGSLAQLVDTVRGAEAQNLRVHAYGSSWSYSDCSYTSDYHVNMSALTNTLNTVQNAFRPTGPSPLVHHVEAGIRLEELNTRLDDAGLALETLGGSSGQTLAGAISTGTHGADKFLPPLADSVLAIHMVGSGGVQYWIEPTDAITDPVLLQQFVAPDLDANNIIYDDTTFNACLVSLGCMGIIYAVVVRVREAYYLEEKSEDISWQAFVDAVPGLLTRDAANARDRFLQLVLDPYGDHNLMTTRRQVDPTNVTIRPRGDRIALIARMLAAMGQLETLPFSLPFALATGELDAFGSQDLARIAQWMHAHGFGYILRSFYADAVHTEAPAATFQNKSWRVMDRDVDYPDRNPNFKNSIPSFSFELAFPAAGIAWVSFVGSVIESLRAGDAELVGYVAIRFSGATRAFLGMQQWDPTCSVEIALLQGVDGQDKLIADFYDMGVQLGGVPHWGQMIDFTGTSTFDPKTVYPRFADWRQVYARLSNNFSARTFENDASIRWGLTTP